MPAYLQPMNGVSLSEAAAEAAAVAPIQRAMLHTFELNHSSLSQPLRVVNDYQDLQAYLEAGSPNTPVLFWAADVKVTRPEESDTAATPTITLTIGNVGGVMSTAIKNADGSLDTWTVTERIYASDDLTAPAVLPPMVLTVTSAAMDGTTCSFNCSFGDPANVSVPALSFKRREYPGLSAR
jgi:hypothetical protein